VAIFQVQNREIIHVSFTRPPTRITEESGPTAYHFTDTATATSHQYNFPVDTEEILNVEGGHGCEFEKRVGTSADPASEIRGS
jgi:hypothetical protein